MFLTYEAVLQPDGRLQFVDLPYEVSRPPRRVLVTFIGDLVIATGNSRSDVAPLTLGLPPLHVVDAQRGLDAR